MTAPGWVTAWSVPLSGLPSVVGPSPPLAGHTVAVTFVPQAGGPQLRLRFSNACGSQPLRLRSGVVEAPGVTGADGSPRPISFDQRSHLDLAPGRHAVSDAIDISVAAGGVLRVTFFVAEADGPATGATSLGPAHGTTEATLGDHTDGRSRPAHTPGSKYLVGAEVLGAPAAIVAFGDSITEAAGAATAYTLALGERLRRGKDTALPVLNAGVSGDALRAGFADRVEREVGLLSGVRGAIILIGINDIGGGRARHPLPTLAALQAGIDRAVAGLRRRNVETWVSPVSPSGDAGRPCTSVPHYSGPERVSLRRALNEWIRSRDYYDSRIDFDAALRDPQFPDRTGVELSADGLHPNDLGQRRMAESIDLSVFGTD